ncbi:MAG: peptidase U32 [Alphaproteobacteria bacterium]|nr:MAG: peptidase U32 [Alphaproteobacteria bacterium]
MSLRPERSELLMPAGNLAKLQMAVLYGADAVYLGTPDMSLRTKSDFTLEEVVEGIEFAHAHGKRVYLTLNLFSHNKDIAKLPQYVETVKRVKPDGLIVADPGVFMFVKDAAPDLELHVSTQANVCSWQSVKFWESQGAKLCVLGREVSFEELAEIREKCPDIKLEAFVHGTMCMTYSGRCLLSNFMAERGANQGACANSCRWKYKVHLRLNDGTVKPLELTEENMEMFEFLLEEEHRPGELMPIEEDERGSYILNSKDLCIMPKLEDYLKIGVDSLKVEGRGKSLYYVAMVARAYRKAIDDWYEDREGWSAEPYMEMLSAVPNRGYTYAFHEGRLTNHAHGYEHTGTIADWEFAGMVHSVEEDAFIVEVKNKLMAGEVLEFMSPSHMTPLRIRLYEFEDIKTGKVTDVIHAGPKPLIRVPFALFDKEAVDHLKTHFPPMTVIRKEKPLSEAERARLTMDGVSQGFELGQRSEAALDRRREALVQAVDREAETASERTVKSPRYGVEGCCGKGCNGCLVFWHDPAYAKAREKLSAKKQGEKLEGADTKPVAAE